MYSTRLEKKNYEKGRIEIKRGDEVCTFDKNTNNLVCGIANHSHYCQRKKEKMWSVRWVSNVERLLSSEVMDCEIMPTDRLIYKGCKVRSLVNNNGEMKRGVCRSVIHHADLRVVGTRTIIARVNMDEFKHLKDYNQHSVVYYNGWLGVISKVTRMAEIIKPGYKNQSTWVPLDSIIPTCPLGRESPMIGEVPDSKSNALLKNLKIKSVLVDWHHQVDSNFPDKPRNKFDESHSKLQLVKEDTSIELLELGSLGRYKIKDDTEFCSWENWQQIFAKKYYPEIVDQLMYNKNESVTESDENSKVARCYDEDNFSQSIQEGKVKSGDILVVELVHLNSTPDIQWQDGTSEIPSSLELEVVNENLMFNLNCLVPGDFIYSQQLDYKSDDAFFVLLSESENSDGRKLVCHVLDANVAGKVLQYNVTIDATPRSLSKRVVRHPLYQYFNEMNTIVVVNEDFESNSITIGHVIGTNLIGKVNVRCIGSGREKWFWPQNCAIYTVRGFDLECIKSHITDCENEAEPERKLRNILDLLKERVELVWKNNSTQDSDLKESFSNLERLYCSLQNIVQRLNADFPHMNVDSAAYLELKLFLQNLPDIDTTYRTSEITNLVLNAVTDLFKKVESILSELTQNVTSDTQMDVDMSSDINLSCIETELEKIFTNTIHILDTHPSHHRYAKLTYQPQSYKLFLKTLKEELVRIEKMCSPEMKTEMGILVRTYNDRMDLFSILIRGPVGTPYEDSLYLFDAVLPSNYPNEPPKFHFHSFRAGRLNPNLYDEGKVCVSLLGTWQGRDQRENWTKDSNIVQILLSIQALILVKCPYHNEPGHEADKYTKQMAKKHNLDYNHQLMPKIVNMMINQVNFGSGLEPWQEILQIFYKNQIPLFIARWKKWLAVTSESSLNQEDRPGFELYPLKKNFIETMTSSIAKLENLYTSKLTV